MNRTPEEWAKVDAAAVVAGSTAQAHNVLKMALQDIAKLAAELDAVQNDQARVGRNRDMWKAQCERQAEQLSKLKWQHIHTAPKDGTEILLFGAPPTPLNRRTHLRWLRIRASDPMRFVKQTRSILIAVRAWYGAASWRGHACSNLLEMTENYTKSTDPKQREQLRQNIAREKARLTGTAT